MKTIALIDGFVTGHHAPMMRVHARALLELGHQLITLTPDAQAFAEWSRTELPQHALRHAAFTLNEPTPSNARSAWLRRGIDYWTQWRVAASAIRHAQRATGWQVDLAFFDYFDHYIGMPQMARAIDAMMPCAWSGLYMQSSYQRFGMRRARLRRGLIDPLAPMRPSRCVAVALLDEFTTDAMQALIHKPVVAFPDVQSDAAPDTDYAPAQMIQARAAGRTVVGLIGSLTPRKGVTTLIEVAQRADPRDTFFVWAGHLAREEFSAEQLATIDAFVASQPSHCAFVFERIPGEPQFNALIAACDMIFAAYFDFPASSGLLSKAALFDKPIIVSRSYCMAQRVQHFEIGATIAQGNAEQCLAAIELLRAKRIDATQFAAYRAAHSPERLRAAFSEIIGFSNVQK
jgi:hypothetical protein